MNVLSAEGGFSVKRNNVIAMLLSICLAVNLFSFSAAYAEEEAEAMFVSEVEFLSSLGVLESDFEPFFTVTRGDFVKIISKILYPGTDFSGAYTEERYVFDDVPVSHENYSCIRACKELSIISGGADGNFRPDDDITVNEAIAVVINALGYTVYANASGGYPSGYVLTASKAGMLKGISVSSEPTGYVLAKLIFNSLFAELVTVESVSEDGVKVTTVSGKNILSERLGINEYDAVVIDDGYTSLTGVSSASEGECIVAENFSDGGRNLLYANGTGIASELGKRLRIFSSVNRESGKNEIIYYSVHSRVNETVLDSSDIISADSSEITYEKKNDESGKLYKLSFAAGGPMVVFNGVKVTENISSYITEDGIVTAVDNDGDKRYDFLNILSFNVEVSNGRISFDSPARNVICGKLNEEDSYIGCKFAPYNGLHLSDASYRLILNDEVKSISDLKENDVISVAMSPEKKDGKYYYQLAVTRAAISGQVESADPDAGRLIISGTEYGISSGLTAVKKGFAENLEFGKNLKFHLDATGKIAYSPSASAGGKNYAYLMGLKYNKNSEELTGRFFTMAGKVEDILFGSKVKVDGNLISDGNEIISALKKREQGSNPAAIGAPEDYFDKNYKRPVILTLNGKGEVSEIDTDNLNYLPDGKMNYYSSEGIIPYSRMEAEDAKALKAGYRNPRIEQLNRYTLSLSGRYYVSDETLVMYVPEIDVYGLDKFSSYASNKVDSGYNLPFNYKFIKLYENSPDESNYSVSSGSSLSHYFGYDIQGYDIDPETGVAGLAVVRGSIAPYSYGRVPYDATYPMYMYLESSEYYDADKEKTVTKLYYTTNGADKQYAIADTDELLSIYRFIIEGCEKSENPYGKKVEPLKKGDIIRIIKTGNELAHIERVFKLATIENALSSALFPSFPRVMYSDNLAGIASMPCDEREYYAGYMSGYYVAVAYPSSLKGNNLVALMGRKYLSDVEVDTPSSYIVQSVDISEASLLLCEINEEGEMLFKEGKPSDIKTVEEYGKEDASILVYHDIYHQVNKIIIINKIGG